MNNAAKAARQLLLSLGWYQPGDLSMEEIAWACGLMVTRKEMDGCEGRIVMGRDGGIISINAAIDYQPKINFILAHEIGHSRMHGTIQPLFADNKHSLAEWYAKGPHEKEANEFATELLMPSEAFSKRVKGQKPSVNVIGDAAVYFGASRTAAFLRYRDLGDFPVMVILVENGIIKWKSPSKDFPFPWLSIDAPVPAFTVAGDYFYRNSKEPNPEKIFAIDWFPDDFNAQRNPKQQLWEQCSRFSEEAIVSCIWTT
jgi:Zn-dependent peptidase ImmA (M78 family)